MPMVYYRIEIYHGISFISVGWALCTLSHPP